MLCNVVPHYAMAIIKLGLEGTLCCDNIVPCYAMAIMSCCLMLCFEGEDSVGGGDITLNEGFVTWGDLTVCHKIAMLLEEMSCFRGDSFCGKMLLFAE